MCLEIIQRAGLGDMGQNSSVTLSSHKKKLELLVYRLVVI